MSSFRAIKTNSFQNLQQLIRTLIPNDSHYLREAHFANEPESKWFFMSSFGQYLNLVENSDSSFNQVQAWHADPLQLGLEELLGGACNPMERSKYHQQGEL